MIAVHKALIALGAILFIGLGIWLMVDPRMTETFYPLTLDGPMAVSEMRAVFGGLMAGVGAGALWLVRRDAAAAGIMMMWVYGGLLIARVVGYFGEGVPNGPVLNETIFETVFFVLLVVTAFLARRR